jgi:hypothetical protein
LGKDKRGGVDGGKIGREGTERIVRRENNGL